MLADERWNQVFALASKIKRCGESKLDDGCGCKQPNKIKEREFSYIIAEWDNVEVGSDESNKVIY